MVEIADAAGRILGASAIATVVDGQVASVTVTAASAERLSLEEGDVVMASFKAAATRLVERASPTGR